VSGTVPEHSRIQRPRRPGPTVAMTRRDPSAAQRWKQVRFGDRFSTCTAVRRHWPEEDGPKVADDTYARRTAVPASLADSDLLLTIGRECRDTACVCQRERRMRDRPWTLRLVMAAPSYHSRHNEQRAHMNEPHSTIVDLLSRRLRVRLLGVHEHAWRVRVSPGDGGLSGVIAERWRRRPHAFALTLAFF
jgi:hypothetical protein